MDGIVDVIELTKALVAKRSITPEDAGCQDLLVEILEKAGFEVSHHRFGEVDNFLATHAGDVSQPHPHLMWIGHTDVVPSGPESQWSSPPFEPAIVDGFLVGRGVADMKGSDAAMVLALCEFVQAHPNHPGRVSLVITSDEEGPAIDGIRALVPHLKAHGLWPDACLVGEPSSHQILGDQIRIGRRGSIQAVLTIQGKQGHTAYALPEDNPVHRAGSLIAALGALRFDDGDEAFDHTRLQISNIQAGTGADNVSPGELVIHFNIRNNPNSPSEAIHAQIKALIESHDPGPWDLSWRVSAEPFGPCSGPFLDGVVKACESVLGMQPKLDTGGGTSDGRFFGPEGVPVIEVGPVNATIHQIDERVAVADLEKLPGLYRAMMETLLIEQTSVSGAIET